MNHYKSFAIQGLSEITRRPVMWITFLVAFHQVVTVIELLLRVEILLDLFLLHFILCTKFEHSEVSL